MDKGYRQMAGTSAGPSNLNLVQHFIDMGFHEELVTKVIKETGESNTDRILETILTYSVLEDFPEMEHNTCQVSCNQQQCVHYDELSSDYDMSLDDSDSDENANFLPENENVLLSLASMGYTVAEASEAIKRCGPGASVVDLIEFIRAAQMAKTEALFFEEEKPKISVDTKLKRKQDQEALKRNKKKGPLAEQDEAGTSAGPSNLNLVQHFIDMGFHEKLVTKVIKESGESNTDRILETILTYSVLEDFPEVEDNTCHLRSNQQQCVHYDELSSDYDMSLDDSDSDENGNFLPENENVLLFLASMGYTAEEASEAMERCGPDASVVDLIEFISDSQMVKKETLFFEEEKPKIFVNTKLKRKQDQETRKRNKKKGPLAEQDEVIRLPNPMIGFGVPSISSVVTCRTLPEAAIGPPFFYFENVAWATKGDWIKISRFLYGIVPEFVDSKYFCAAARKRGYVHNLPINNRFPLLPFPPRTIHEAFPLTKKWWPEWDKRTNLNCLRTSHGTAILTKRIRKALEKCGDNPPDHVKKSVYKECRNWNLIWVGKNKLATLEPDEVEMLLGFPRNHTRGGALSRTDRYKSLGNSFQVDTVAYHLSVLKDIYPNGVNVLSLFSGIGGAEVALHKLGIHLKNVVSVEISEANRDVMKSWWQQTGQKGNLVHLDDVKKLNPQKLEKLVKSVGGFDLIIGGSPCNNMAGSNRVSRVGLVGEQSSLFYDYSRILKTVKIIMNQHKS